MAERQDEFQGRLSGLSEARPGGRVWQGTVSVSVTAPEGLSEARPGGRVWRDGERNAALHVRGLSEARPGGRVWRGVRPLGLLLETLSQ